MSSLVVCFIKVWVGNVICQKMRSKQAKLKAVVSLQRFHQDSNVPFFQKPLELKSIFKTLSQFTSLFLTHILVSFNTLQLSIFTNFLMGCFLGCFGGSSKRKRRKPAKKVLLLPRDPVCLFSSFWLLVICSFTCFLVERYSFCCRYMAVTSLWFHQFLLLLI